MDLRTEEVLQLIKSQNKTRNLLTILCYALIIGGLFVYIFYAFNQSRAIKLVKKHSDNLKEYQTEKIMTNPRIKIKHDEGNIYDIRAKKAFHENEEEVKLFDVFAEGKLGKITSGELHVSEEGDHLVFTKNPILILNQTEK
ncbi:MAG: hypothetical protein KGP29_06360 [Proteobacteria bacterium]|nr:hypothetical protein [Pseudomonadota bacterium]